MPLDELILTIVNITLIGLALYVFLYFLSTGRLGEKQLRLGPTRDLHQPAWVYAIAIVGVLAYSALKLTATTGQPLWFLLLIEIIPYAMVGLLLGRARASEAGFRKIGLLPRWPKRDAWWGLASGVVSLGLAGGVGFLVNFISTRMGQPVDPVAHEALQTLREEFTVDMLVALIITAVILAPLIEEIVFRGVFQTALLWLFRGTRWPAILIASFVFAIIHHSVVPWQGLISLFVLGIVWGYTYERTGSLLAPILAHAVFNAANIAIALNLPDPLPQ